MGLPRLGGASMAGILRYGAYIPYFRLAGSEIDEAWPGRGSRGEKAVANHDEDSITLAVEAARDCLDGWDRSRIDGLFFVSTTSPYREKQGASLIASVLGLRADILTADFAQCLRAGTTALEVAKACTQAGRAGSILVTFADTRTVHPAAPQEPWLGDGAAAFLIGQGRCGVEWQSFASVSNEMMDTWRTEDDRFVQSWEDRWVKQHGFLAQSGIAIEQALQKSGLSAKQLDRAVLCAPDSRSHRQLAGRLKLAETTKLMDPLLDSVGAAGAAHAPLMLAHALEEAGPGETILMAGYGDGADALVLKTTEHVKDLRGRKAVKGHLASKQRLPNYERYLWYRRLVEVDPPQPLLVGSSATVLWRERSSVLRLHGSRCRTCGEAAFPIQRICNGCRAKDAYDEIPLAEQRGRLFTYTLDYLASQADPPLIQSVVDLEPGCRLYTSMTDADANEVRVDMEVEMTFRRTRKAEGFYNYFWKCRPVR
jgi:hydroxymethylglutaryl-CoA synthase